MARSTPGHVYHDLSVKRDKYGGYTDLSFEGTGFFRLHHDKRWWLVDPEGNAFLSFGINHIERGRVLHAYNRKYWAQQFDIAPDSEPGKRGKERFKGSGVFVLDRTGGTW